MTVKQLIEELERYDPETTVQVAFPSTGWDGNLYRDTRCALQLVKLNRPDGVHPLISVNGAHLLEE